MAEKSVHHVSRKQRTGRTAERRTSYMKQNACYATPQHPAIRKMLLRNQPSGMEFTMASQVVHSRKELLNMLKMQTLSPRNHM